ncbi:uncharacterized protein LOC125337316 isoform X2 [Corvus hawaiiensis]|uniref:uncharacterized protein LOC125337316 isoform X2 n=1 Tax=Corvus hawaiiensis TaxID=134902 RepID=UPI002019B59F|nr:uncharacterized protein LOC125337316 isoform X2 [Corvus hawaiiensis]
MGRQRAPPGPCWRRLLRAGCWWLLSLCGTALRGLRGLWSLTWVLLICYKSCWDGAFQVTEELGTALQLRLEGSEEEEDGDSDSALEPGQTGQWWGCSSMVMPARPCCGGWRHWRPTCASSARSWGLRSFCGAAGSWSCCGNSKACTNGCRSCHGSGTGVTAPSCSGKQRTKVPVGVRERAQKDTNGWRHHRNHVVSSSLTGRKCK